MILFSEGVRLVASRISTLTLFDILLQFLSILRLSLCNSNVKLHKKIASFSETLVKRNLCLLLLLIVALALQPYSKRYRILLA